MTAEQLKQQLLAKGLSQADADTISRNYAKGIADAAASSRSSSSSTSSLNLSGSAIKNLVSAAASGYYDRLSNTQARINAETMKTMVEKIVAMPSLNPFTLINNVLNAGAGVLDKVMTDFAKLNDNLIESVKGNSGYVGQIGDDMINGMREAVIATTRLGISVDDFLTGTQALMQSSERMVLYSEETLYAGMEASMAYTKSSKTLLENAESFRNVGIGLNDSAKAIEDIGKRSASLGLSAKATSETLIKQIGRLNEFGFQNGVRGLGKMVQEAQALKINMDEIFKVAVDLYDPEKAINLAANLQVVGGAVGDLADPIKLMYDATNNVESLQTSIIGAARSLATYNAEQGRFEVTGVNLRRAKAMADALNISMGELTNMAVKGAAKFEAMSQLDMFPDLTDDQKEFVSNLSTIKDGRVGFDLPDDIAKRMGLTNLNDGFIAIDDLSTSQIVQFKEMQEKIAKTSTVDIARSQLNYTTQISSTVSAIYLRMMEDGRRSEIGQKAIATTQKASEMLYDNFDASKMTSTQMLDKAVQMAKENLGEIIQQSEIDKLKNMLPDVSNYIEQGKNIIQKAGTEINIPEIYENIKREAEPVIEKGKQFLRDYFDLNVKVDLNSNSPELANIFLSEINKNPRLRADLAESIFGNKKDFVG